MRRQWCHVNVVMATRTQNRIDFILINKMWSSYPLKRKSWDFPTWLCGCFLILFFRVWKVGHRSAKNSLQQQSATSGWATVNYLNKTKKNFDANSRRTHKVLYGRQKSERKTRKTRWKAAKGIHCRLLLLLLFDALSLSPISPDAHTQSSQLVNTKPLFDAFTCALRSPIFRTIFPIFRSRSVSILFMASEPRTA